MGCALGAVVAVLSGWAGPASAASSRNSTTGTTLPSAPFAYTEMTGSGNRLIVTGQGASNDTSPSPGRVPVAAYRFHTGRWMRLPDAHMQPVAVRGGLVGVGLTCGAWEDSNARCKVFVETLRWGDRHWQRTMSDRKPAWVHEGYGATTIGRRGRRAYFSVYRSKVEVIRVGIDGSMRWLPAPPSTPIGQQVERFVTCVARHGLDHVELRTVSPPLADDPISQPGPLWHLDETATHPRWREVPHTDPILQAGAPGFAGCHTGGIIFMYPPTTSAWVDGAVETIEPTSTPREVVAASQSTATCCVATADGGVAVADGLRVYALQHAQWTTTQVYAGFSTMRPIPLAAVGTRIVYRYSDDSGRDELRVLAPTVVLSDHIDGDGVYQVGTEIRPGRYQTDAGPRDCVWRIAQNGRTVEAGRQGVLPGGEVSSTRSTPVTIRLRQGQTLKVTGCGAWSRDP
jgi:hypothetical protein